jgi:hypothetical protein
MAEEQQEPVVRRGRGRPRKQIAEPVRETVRQAARDSSGNVVVMGRDGEILTRSRKEGIDPFDVPVKFIPIGWSYQWNAISTYGNSEIFQAQNVEFHQNGWRPVPASRHDGFFMPKGHKGSIIIRGQQLMERPEALTQEAKDEHERRANQQMRDRDAALMGGRANVRQAARGGFEMGGRYRGTGGDVRITVDPALDVQRPNYEPADDSK